MVKSLLLLLLLSSCSIMDRKVDDFPPMKTIVHVVEPGDIYKICAPLLGGYLKGILTLPMACANVNLDTKECNIYITKTSPPETLEHEQRHCAGYWHDDGLQIYYDNWKKKKRRINNGN